MREVRFSLPPGGPVPAQPDGPINSWAGWPATTSVAPYLVARLTVAGTVDPQTGYLVDIKLLDRILRASALPILFEAFAEQAEPRPTTERALARIWKQVCAACPPETPAVTLELLLTPFLRFSAMAEKPGMTSLTQAFEFAASHRLYNPALSEQQNRAIFGKCANPNGHGHNYRLEVTLTGELDADTGLLVSLAEFEKTVLQRVIEQLDHKHLNLDLPEFAETIPSVENIARLVWDRLVGRFGRARLASVRVWETPKTCAEYTALRPARADPTP